MYQIWVRTDNGWQLASEEKMERLQAHSLCRQFKTAGNMQDYTYCLEGECPCW
jgi:hypothetical protein